MTSAKNLLELVDGYGFENIDYPGFVGFTRVRGDDVDQSLRIFLWKNKKHAEKIGMPHSYMVLCPGFTSPEEQGRIAVLMAKWPCDDQEDIPWSVVSAQVRASFLPLFDLHDIDAWEDHIRDKTILVPPIPFPVLK